MVNFRHLKLWTLLLTLGFAVGFYSSPCSASVTSQFVTAQKLFNQGQISKAAKILAANIKKYPGHQPSQLLLGRIYFRVGRISSAARHFKMVAPDLVGADAGYEYGVTMFTINNCGKALSGFAKVPQGAREYDLAQFYRGVCHMRARRWSKAEYYLNRSHNLPANLESTKRRLLSSVRKQVRAERQGQVSRGNPYVIVPTPPQQAMPYPYPYPYQGPAVAPGAVPGDAPGQTAAAKAPPKPKPPSSGFSKTVTPSLTLTQASGTVDYFGLKNAQSETRTTLLNLNFTGKYDFSARGSGSQPYASIGVDAGQKNIDTHGNTVTNIVTADDPGTIREQYSETAPTSTRAGKLSVTPEVGYPLTDAFDITAGYAFKESYPDMKGDLKTGTHTPYGSVSLGAGTLTFKLAASQEETLGVNAEGQGGVTIKSTTIFGGEASKSFDNGASISVSGEQRSSIPIGDEEANGCGDSMRQCTKMSFGMDLSKAWESFSVALGVDQVSYTPPSGQVKMGEDSSLTAELSGTQSFDFGGTFIVSGSMAQRENYKALLDDPKAPPKPDGTTGQSILVAAGTVQTIKASFKLSPFEWIYGLMSYSMSQYSYQISKGNHLEDKFQQNNAERTTTFTLELGLSKNF
jgi:hypothetical protein